jgi:hypothetical protein
MSAIASAAGAADAATDKCTPTAHQSSSTINVKFAAIVQLVARTAQLLAHMEQQHPPSLPAALGNVARANSNEQQQGQHPAWHVDQSAQDGPDQHPEDLVQLQLWLLLLWQDLFRLHCHGMPCLQQQQMNTAAQQLVQQALHGSSESMQLQLSAGICSSLQEASTTALTLMAAGDAAGLAASTDLATDAAATASGITALQVHAAPILLQLLAGDTSSSSSSSSSRSLNSIEQRLECAGQVAGGSPAARAAYILQLLADSSSVMAWHGVFCWIQPLVLAEIKAGSWVSLDLLPSWPDLAVGQTFGCWALTGAG